MGPLQVKRWLIWLLLMGMVAPVLAAARYSTAYELGFNLSLGLLGRARGAETKTFLDKAMAQAKQLGVTLPPFPAVSKEQTQDTVQALGYLLRDMQRALKPLKDKKEITLVEIGIKSVMMRSVYTPGDDHGIVRVLEDRTKRFGIKSKGLAKMRKAVKEKQPIEKIGPMLEEFDREMRSALKGR